MNRIVLKNCRIFDGEKFLPGSGDILMQNGIIKKTASEIKADVIIDCNGRTAVPGYIDIHTHGMAGFDNSDISEKDFDEMERQYLLRGTTTFIPTFPTLAIETIRRSLDVYRKFRDRIPGIHLEGPFINSEKKGAQNQEFIIEPGVEPFIRYTDGYLDLIKRVTLSPEMDQGFRLTDFLLSKNIKVSFGHTVCNYEKAMEFFSHTDSIATHLFNAMPAVHHRNPGITTAALLNRKTMCEIIPDMIHLHPAIIEMIFRLKGKNGTICISDSIMAAGLKPGDYNFSGLSIHVDESSARLESGNLAGSIITMADGVKRMIENGIEAEYALTSATSAPAKAMGLDEKIGYIKEGMNADILLLGIDFGVEKAFKGGRPVI